MSDESILPSAAPSAPPSPPSAQLLVSPRSVLKTEFNKKKGWWRYTLSCGHRITLNQRYNFSSAEKGCDAHGIYCSHCGTFYFKGHDF